MIFCGTAYVLALCIICGNYFPEMDYFTTKRREHQ